jgi:hypothetical protein
MNREFSTCHGERGSASTKFFITMVFLGLVLHAGYNYIPVAYEAESMKAEMHTAVIQGLATPGKMSPVDNVKARVKQAAQINQVPADAVMEIKQAGNAITAHVAYVKRVNILPFGIYKYDYAFDHTATPTGFLLKASN